MRIYLTLLRRELAGFFVSITGYVIIAAVTLLIGLGFATLITMLMSPGTDAQLKPVTELFYDSLVFWFIILLISPVITMRLFALEKFTGTYETLMTTPVKDIQVVAAKFSAAIIFYMVMWLPLLACIFIVGHFAKQGSLDPGTVCGTYLGIFLIGCLFLSLGCFASSLTRNQMVAAMVSFVLGITLFSLSFLARAIQTPVGWKAQVISSFAMFDQMDNFARGMVDVRTIIFYVTLTFLFLFLTLRILEGRRWK